MGFLRLNGCRFAVVSYNYYRDAWLGLAILTSLLSGLKGRAQAVSYFPPVNSSEWARMSPDSLCWRKSAIDSLYTYLESEQSKAFLLVYDGKIVLEKYFGTFKQDSLWYWASAGKTLTATLVGITAHEGHLNLDSASSKYQGIGWTSLTPDQERKITVRHQLTMTSGLNDEVSDPFCTLPSCLVYKAEPGTRWAYHNAPYTLLDQVISGATGQTLSQYFAQKIRNPIGMNGQWFSSGYNNVYVSTARSMARFGLLIQNKGKWQNTVVVADAHYLRSMTTPSQTLNPSYGYLWWLNGQGSYRAPGVNFPIPGMLMPNAPTDLIAAIGMNGQLLNVVPSQKWVVVRMGNQPLSVPVPFLLNDNIWKYLKPFINTRCQPTNVAEPPIMQVPSDLRTSLADNRLWIETPQAGDLVLYNLTGQIVAHESIQPGERSIEIPGLSRGTYFMRFRYQNLNMKPTHLKIIH
jgi:CubicO group peptidase (beta-lactamase class C family)